MVALQVLILFIKIFEYVLEYDIFRFGAYQYCLHWAKLKLREATLTIELKPVDRQIVLENCVIVFIKLSDFNSYNFNSSNIIFKCFSTSISSCKVKCCSVTILNLA